MSDIKTKDIKPKFVKTLDKATAWTERIKDPIVYANEKSKDVVSNEGNVIDYGADKIKYVSNRVKDESIYAGKKAATKTKDVAIKKYKNRKIKKIKNTKRINNTIKTTKRRIRNAEKTTKEAIKISKRMLEEGRKLAIKGTKLAIKGTKAAIKLTIKLIKAIISAVKSLVGMLIAGGTAALIAIVIICLIALLVGSIYGVFFSSDSSNEIKMSDCIIELNNKMDQKIEGIKNRELHDEVIVESNMAQWKDILSMYAVRVSNDNKEEVKTITSEKKKILEEIFWDMNTISYDIKIEEYTSTSIDSRNSIELSSNRNNIESGGTKRVLHIYINSVSPDLIKTKYNFSEKQLKQYAELTNDKNNILWSTAIYGIYGSSGEYATWKQRGREWSNIRIGNTNKTIGDVGCLVTSISILIKKSGISTNGIYPFNPGTFVTALNNAYGFDGANLQYGPISKVVPGFEYAGRVYLSGKSKNEKLHEIKKYYGDGYYIVAEVLGASDTAQHWVAIDKVTNNTILMLDPGSDATNMWNQYDWNLTSQFVYFKVNQ